MVRKIEDFKNWLNIIYNSVIGVLTLTIISTFEKTLENKSTTLVLVIVGLIVVTKLFDWFIENLIESSEKLRKVIMGKYFFEGWWVDGFFAPDDPYKITTIAIFKIFYENGNFVSTGRGYDINGKELRSFKTTFSFYQSSRLIFAFKGINKTSHDYNYYGYGEYNFSLGKKHPTTLNGFVESDNSKRMLWGEKIMDKALLNKIDEEETRTKIIESILKRKGI